MRKGKDLEKEKKAQALDGKSYLNSHEDNDVGRKPAKNQGGEYIDNQPNKTEKRTHNNS